MRIGGFNPCYVFKNETITTELRECTKFEFIVEEPTMVTQVCRASRFILIYFLFLLAI